MVVHLGVSSSINVDCCSFVAATISPMQLSNDSTQLNVESFVAEKKVSETMLAMSTSSCENTASKTM